MAVGAIFATNVTSAAHHGGGLSKDLQSLQKSLAEGDISAAQQAFTQYKQNLPSIGVKKTGVEESTRNNAEDTLRVDVRALQNALSAGDIPGAQDAFLKLKQDSRRSQPANEEKEISLADSEQTRPEQNTHPQAAAQAAGAQSNGGGKLNVYA
jgi:hypothetical protein